MYKLVIALVLCALATTANAGGNRSSLLQCGINLGSASLTYHAKSAAKKFRDKRMNHVAGTLRVEPAYFNTALAAGAQKVEKRLPPKFTVATIGCSWR